MNPADSDISYAYWTGHGDRVKVTYSLSVFHEIDFQASEGFRRIPHGGIETGGLLFGRLEQDGSYLSVQIEAFRMIECEHASGPSFNLSERDIAGLRAQVAAAPSDPELQGLQVLGWFVAHTRSPLEMNEREATLFGQLFPGPGRLLMLVKPERFQATRFGFIVRGADGRLERDASSSAIILPLPGRAGRATQGPSASIPAPAQSPPTVATVPPPRAAPPPPLVPPKRAVAPELEPSAPSFWRDVPAQPSKQEPIVRIEEPPAEVSEPAHTMIPVGAVPLGPEAATKLPITRQIRREGRPSTFRLVLLLLLAAALGCGVGYFAYKQLPAATIALNVKRSPASGAAASAPGLVVSWPSEETRDALFASIRVDDGEATPLTNQQKEAGRVLLLVSGDNVKIELIAQRRWRDSRGIVRYLRAKGATP